MRRRNFLRTVTTGTAAFATAPYVLRSDNTRVFRTALIGSGWWGKNILREGLAAGRCKIVGLADVDANALEVAADQVTNSSNAAPKLYRDYREMLAREKPDLVIVATPDHWHALNTIDALKAGAHVFVEKPPDIPLPKARPCSRPRANQTALFRLAFIVVSVRITLAA